MKLAAAMVWWGLLTTSAALAQGAVPIYALSDEADPILLSQPEWDFSNPAAVQIVFMAENETERPLTARDVWVWVRRYYQPNENRVKNMWVPFDCARLGRIEGDQPLPHGEPVQLRTPLRPDCAIDPATHQHWVLELERAGGAGNPDLAFWTRPVWLVTSKLATLPK